MTSKSEDQFLLVLATILIALALFSNRPCAEANESSYQITKLEDVKGKAVEIMFDSDSVTYIRTEQDLYRLSNQTTVKFSSPNVTRGMVICKMDDVYLFTSQGYQYHQIDTLWLIKKGSLPPGINLFSFRHEKDQKYQKKYFIDANSNIYFNTETGVVFLRADQNVLLRIRNLEGFHFNMIDEDEVGNVYLADSAKEKDSLFMVTREAKLKSPLPYATIVPNINKKIMGFKVWGNVPLFVERTTDKISTVKSLLREPTDFLLSQYEVQYVFLNKTSDRFFIIEQNSHSKSENHLYFISRPMDVVHANQSVINPPIIKDNGTVSYVLDEHGNAYFAYKRDNKRIILLLKSDKIEFKEIAVPTQQDIYDLAVDGFDNLWILTDELYILEQGSEVPVQISKNKELGTANGSFLKINTKTNQVYIGSNNVNFVVVKK